jgi:anti-sigma regulatory factor (Ser/Thr protein kinase)
LTIQISDPGQGFDVGPVRQELDKRHQDGQWRRGWGLKIMEELMDELHVESGEHGTKITMVKRRPDRETD